MDTKQARTAGIQQGYFDVISKRDGRQVSFDKSKIADAIFKAACSVGGEDRMLAEELASAVTLYLRFFISVSFLI